MNESGRLDLVPVDQLEIAGRRGVEWELRAVSTRCRPDVRLVVMLLARRIGRRGWPGSWRQVCALTGPHRPATAERLKRELSLALGVQSVDAAPRNR